VQRTMTLNIFIGDDMAQASGMGVANISGPHHHRLDKILFFGITVILSFKQLAGMFRA